MKKLLKVAFLTLHYPPPAGSGAANYAYHITQQLAKLGHEIHIFCPRISHNNDKYIMSNKGVIVHKLNTINKPFLFAISFWISLISKIFYIRNYFDIVHGNGIADFCLNKFFIKRPRIITTHHLGSSTVKMLKADGYARWRNMRSEIGITSYLQKKCIKSADMVITVSNFTKLDIIKTFNTPESKIKVIYNGINYNDFTVPKRTINKAKKTFGFSERPVLLFVGRLEPRKGIDILLKAMVKILQNMDVELLLVGPGEQTKYRELASCLGILEKVRFFGRVSDELLKILFASCDLFVLPSRLEGFGLVLVEAMAAGKPVVATNVGGIPEVVKSMQNGILVDADDENALALAVVSILRDKILLENIGNNNRVTVQKRFSWQEAALMTEKLYLETMGTES